MSYPILFGNMAGQGSLDGLTLASAAPSAQYLYDNGVRTDGVYWITHPTVGAKQTYCEFRNNEGWMLITNIKSNYYGTTDMTWNDNANWRYDGSNLGSVTNPWTGTGHYRDRDTWRYWLASKVMIKVHNNNTMFGSGSWVAFQLTSTYQNNTFKNIFSAPAGCLGGSQVSNAWYAQQGMATGGSIGATTGYATNLDFCPISRNIGPNGHLRANHMCGNNGVRLLTSFQVLESSNQDNTVGLANHHCLNNIGNIDTVAWDTGCAYNGTVFGFLNVTSDGGSKTAPYDQRQFTSQTYPDGSNAQAASSVVPYSGPYYHYAIYVK